MSLPDLVREVKCSVPDVTMVHLNDMASFSTLLKPKLYGGIKGMAKPRCFIIKRDSVGVVRHKYRLHVQTSKKTSPDCWMPHNTVGFQVLKEDPDESRLRKVSYKPCDHEELSSTLETYKSFLDVNQLRWWTDVLRRFEEEDKSGCPHCKKLRTTLSVNGRSKTDSDEVRKDKARISSAAYKESFTHMEDPTFDNHHPRYEAPFPVNSPSVFPSPKFFWVNGSYEGSVHEETIQLSSEDQHLVSEISAQLQEGIPCHNVSGKGRNISQYHYFVCC